MSLKIMQWNPSKFWPSHSSSLHPLLPVSGQTLETAAPTSMRRSNLNRGVR
jgi:hypothetical protein